MLFHSPNREEVYQKAIELRPRSILRSASWEPFQRTWCSFYELLIPRKKRPDSDRRSDFGPTRTAWAKLMLDTGATDNHNQRLSSTFSWV